MGGITFHPLMPGGAGSLRGASVDVETIGLLEGSFRVLAPRGDELVERFYTRLFERYPGVRGMFPVDLRAQRAKLLDTLSSVIEGLRAPEAVRSRLRELGAAHARLGARPEHYPPVCACLVEAMREAAGPSWDARLEIEWSRALEMIALLMLEGAGSGVQAHRQAGR